MKKINDTTLTADDLGDVKPKVLIGGKDASKFVPNVNASFFDNEFYFNLNRKEKTVKTDTAYSVTSEKAELSGDDTDVFHEKNGRLKWDIRFSSQPANLKLTWEIKCSKGLEFYYQDELSEEEKKEECFRPDDIIGSYAVYCNKKHNKYKTGKLFHIPRPFVIDSNGSTEWCVISIADGSLTITLPETFMRSAVYPVTLDPTFGYDSIGASNLNFDGRDPTGSLYGAHTASSGEAITGFSIATYTTDTSGSLELAAYSIVDGGLASRLADPVSITGITASDAAWYSTSGLSQSMSSGAAYGVAVGGGLTCRGCYDSSGTNYADADTYGGSLPESWHTSYSIKLAIIMSIYATYTASGGTVANNYYYRQNQ